MKKHKQKNKHDPENGVYGDCGRTVLACLLDLKPEDVPHFYENGGSADEAHEKRDAWLADRGLTLMRIAYFTPNDALKSMKNLNPGMFYVLFGKSRTGVGHVVICLDDEIYWDPSLTSSGIVGPLDEVDMVFVELLVPIFMKAKL